MTSDHETAFRALAEDPERWRSSARNLLAAADLLWVTVAEDFRGDVPADTGLHADVSETHPPGPARPFLRDAAPYLMLAGFAIENALKALRVVQGIAVTRDGKVEPELASEILTHRLLKMAGAAGLALSAREQELLGRLETYLTWAGRYPVATTASGQAVVQNAWASDKVEVTAFFERVQSLSGRPVDVEAE